jgi:8-oxo-dGTP pyrophosphatase MutT (NUDIX family)
MIKKSLLVPFNSKGEIFIQDRRGHRAPPWGFFGGSIETGESPLDAVIRETKEELNIDLLEEDITFVALFESQFEGEDSQRYFYLYQTDQEIFEVFEGAGGEWVSFEEADGRLIAFDRLPDLREMISSLLSKKS